MTLTFAIIGVVTAALNIMKIIEILDNPENNRRKRA